MEKLAKAIKMLKNSERPEDKLVADFIDQLEGYTPMGAYTAIGASCDQIITAAAAIRKAALPPVLRIKQDDCYGDNNPREHCNFGTMVCWHTRYNLGDEQPQTTPEFYFEKIKPCIRLPIYMYDHSGITIRTSPFSDGWDSGQLGWIYVTSEKIKSEFKVKSLNGAIKNKARSILEQEVKLYDQYLRGAVWGFEFGDDSCWGFIGDELEETGLLEALADIGIPEDVIRNAWDERTP